LIERINTGYWGALPNGTDLTIRSAVPDGYKKNKSASLFHTAMLRGSWNWIAGITPAGGLTWNVGIKVLSSRRSCGQGIEKVYSKENARV